MEMTYFLTFSYLAFNKLLVRKYYFTITLQRQIYNYFTKTDLQLKYKDRFTITLQRQLTVTSCIPFLNFYTFFFYSNWCSSDHLNLDIHSKFFFFLRKHIGRIWKIIRIKCGMRWFFFLFLDDLQMIFSGDSCMTYIDEFLRVIKWV